MPNAPTYEYSWDFGMGPGPWTTWLGPSVIRGDSGAIANFTRFNPPGVTDVNHLDGIGALHLLAHLSIPTIGSPGILNLQDADFQITVRGQDFQANGGKLVIWLCRYIPEEGITRNYYVGLEVTNWANTGNDLASQITDEWQTLTVHLSNDPADWTYAGNAPASQGDWADRYEPFDLDQTIQHTDATLHLVFLSDEPDEEPAGFIDIANITVRTQTPATPVGANSTTPPEIFYGLEDQGTTGSLTAPGNIDMDHATFSVVGGSARNGSVTIDPATGAFTFTPNADYYGPTDFVGAATFQYEVTDGTNTSGPRSVYMFIGPINDAPVTTVNDVAMEIAHDQPFSYTVFGATDVDKERLSYHLVDGSEIHGTVTLDSASGRYVFTPEAGYTGAATFQYYVSDGQLDSAPATITLNVHAAGDDPARPTFDQLVNATLLQGDYQGFVHGTVLLAIAGDPNASYHYGTWLHYGQNVTRSPQLAAQYLTAASHTVPDAAIQLADMYASGDGVAQDYVHARELLAYWPNNASAVYHLAILYDHGYGGPIDHETGVEMYLKASNMGNADAMWTLGRRYLMAEGVAFSAEDAYFWLGVALKFNGGPVFPLKPDGTNVFTDLLHFNQAQAVNEAGLTAGEVADLDAMIAAWSPGQASPVNDAPVAAIDSTIHEGMGGQPLSGALALASDPDGDRLSYGLVVDSAQHGTVSLNATTGAWVFTPEPGYTGPASFQYVVSDGLAVTSPVTVDLEFAPSTDAVNDAGFTAEATPLAVDASAGLLANDTVSPGGTSITITAVAGSSGNVGQAVAGAHGSITINADGSYAYTPDAATAALTQGQSYVDTFSYTITDGEGVTDTATLSITITGASGTVLTGSGVLIGSAFDDVITGSAAHDTLLGQGGNDRLIDGAGAADELYGGTGDDVYVVSNGGDTIVENADEGVDTVETALSSFTQRNNVENLTYTGTGAFIGVGNSLDNVIRGGVGADNLNGGGGNDTLIGGTGAANIFIGGTGDDVFEVSVAGDIIFENAGEGVDTVRTALATRTLATNVENLIYTGNGDFVGTGNAGLNAITGGVGNDTLDGRAGADVLTGGLGDDTYIVDDAGDVVIEAADQGVDTIRTTLNAYMLGDDIENLVFTGSGAFTGTGNALANDITGGGAGDTLDGGAGADTLRGGAGNDTYVVDDAGDVVVEVSGQGTDEVRTALTSYTLGANVENLTFTGTVSFTGTGNELANAITGGDEADILDGRAGADVLTGGLGDDLYLVDDVADVVVENDGEGTDEVRASANVYILSDQVENLTFTGTGDFAGTGNGLDNVIAGGDGNDTLDGGAGADQLIGGLGDDTYRVDDVGDVIVEMSGEGTDTVETTLSSYGLGDDVENLTFVGTGDFTGTGNALDNVITGGGGADWLDGGEGRDTMAGGLGDDVYVVDDVFDVATENADGGTDEVRTTVATWVLTDNIENLTYLGTDDFLGYGNALDNTLSGGAGADTLWGYEGDDVLIGGPGAANFLIGGTGDDTYFVTADGDIVFENADEGSDTVFTDLSAFTLFSNLETLVYIGAGDFEGTGNSGDNLIQGGAGNDTLDGGLGADFLRGGLGDDVYVVDDEGDYVAEVDGEGTDEVRTDLASYHLTEGVENLTYTGFGFFDGFGNALNNVITGGDDDDILDGGAGDDTLNGGLGDDYYVVDSVGDVVNDTGGIDAIETTLSSYTLGADIEDLIYAGAGDFLGTGNGSDNYIEGQDGDDVLEGLDGDDFLTGGLGADQLNGGTGNDQLTGDEGADVMTGGLGDDSYLVDDAGDVVVELDDEGVDDVTTTLNNYTLTANVEALFFAGSGDFVGVGNDLDNLISGGLGADDLSGGGGSDVLFGDVGDDILRGGLGDDFYLVDDAGDQTIELDGEGVDEVDTILDAWTLSANIENLVYAGGGDFAGTGNALDNDILGWFGNDTLDGKEGADTLTGGLGDDTYVVDNAGDVVVELADEGDDLVRVVGGLSAYTLGADVERLQVEVDGAFALTGNALDNTLTSTGIGNDTLDGGAGADAMAGGRGDDIYVVDNAGDTVTEAADEGADTVRTTLAAYALGANIENLVFTGAGAFAGTGNALANAITGGAGNDALDGGAGADVLTGGLGDDVYVVDDAGDSVVEATGEGRDRVQTALAVYALAANVEDLTYTGGGAFTGSGNALANVITGGGGADVLRGGGGLDTLNGGGGLDTADYSQAASGVVVRLDLNVATNDGDGSNDILSSIENANGSAFNDTLFGSSGANVLSGGLGRDVLLGFAGNDVLIGGDGVANQLQGGLGDDRYIVTAVGDSLIELAGEGIDTVETNLASLVLAANIENLLYTGAGAFTGTGNAGDNAITGGALNDVLSGGAGLDVLNGGDGDDSLTGGAGVDTLNGGNGVDTVDYSAAAAGVTARLDINRTTNDGDGGTDTLSGIENLTGSTFDDTLFGSAGANVLIGGAGRDVLLGFAGNDVLIGGAGTANQLQGGLGDDRYVVTAADSIVELAGEGTDIVETSLGAFTLAANVENLTFTGTGAFFGFGNASANIIVGGASADQLDGKDGDDLLRGGGGADTLLGGIGVDTLLGEAGNDILNGGAGDDILTGATGDDRYVVDSVGDVIIELAGEGTDTVQTTLNSYVLGATLENLVFSGAGDFTATGNAANNVITGGAGNDTFIAGAGNDTFNGGSGVDTVDYSAVGAAITVKMAGLQTTNDGQGGVDYLNGIERIIGTAFDDSIFGDSYGNTLIGGLGRDTLLGMGGDDVLIGGTGLANIMQGGTGNDRYVVSAVGDTVFELVGEGTDTVETDLAAHTLAANLENLTYTGAATFTGTGNGLANVITGGAGDDMLRGAGGADTLEGGGGVDIALYAGLRSDYTIVAISGGYRITDNAAGVDGDEGVDVLHDVEKVRFKDGTVVTLADLGLTPAPVTSSKHGPETSPLSATAGHDVDVAPLVLPASGDDFLVLTAKAGDDFGPQVLPAGLDTAQVFDNLTLALTTGHWMLTLGEDGQFQPFDSLDQPGGPPHHLWDGIL